MGLEISVNSKADSEADRLYDHINRVAKAYGREAEGDGIPRTLDGTPYEPLNGGKVGVDTLEITEGDRTARLIDPRTRTMRPVRWLWYPYIRRDGLNVLAGAGGSRKSTLAAWIASKVTRGELTDKHSNRIPAGRVLYVSQGEDELDSILLPRIEAQGTDPDLFRVLQISVPAHDGGSLDVATGAHDLGLLRRMVNEYRPTLLILDPLSLLIDGDINSYRDAQPALVACNELSQLGDGCAVLGLHHWNRTGTFNGSQKFEDTARVFLEIATDPNDPASSIVSVAKSNNGVRTSLKVVSKLVPFQTSEGTDDVQIIDRVEASSITVDDIRAARMNGDDAETMDDAGAWLLSYLSNSTNYTALATEVQKAGNAAGWTTSQIKAAKNRLRKKIVSVKDSQVFAGRWSWRLVDGAPSVSAPGR